VRCTSMWHSIKAGDHTSLTRPSDRHPTLQVPHLAAPLVPSRERRGRAEEMPRPIPVSTLANTRCNNALVQLIRPAHRVQKQAHGRVKRSKLGVPPVPKP
jgi:hypothetical protein